MSTCQEENRCILDVCAADLSQRDKENLLLFFNHSWKKPMVHWCGPGCCSSESHCQDRFKEAIDIALGSFPDIPLLYRWKAFEPAANYALRGCLLHQIWPHVLGAAVRDVADDSADAAPAVSQQCCWQIRQNKTGPTHLFNPGFRLNRCFNVDAAKNVQKCVYIYPLKRKT